MEHGTWVKMQHAANTHATANVQQATWSKRAWNNLASDMHHLTNMPRSIRHWANPMQQRRMALGHRSWCHLRIAISAWGSGLPRPYLHGVLGSPAHICAGTGLTPPTFAPGLGSPLPTFAPGLGSPRPHRRRDWAHPAHICAGHDRVHGDGVRRHRAVLRRRRLHDRPELRRGDRDERATAQRRCDD